MEGLKVYFGSGGENFFILMSSEVIAFTALAGSDGYSSYMIQ
jgi:hypothetical protein